MMPREDGISPVCCHVIRAICVQRAVNINLSAPYQRLYISRIDNAEASIFKTKQ